MAKNTLRSGQVITTFGPGSLLDLPDCAAILGGLDNWNYDFNEITTVTEPRLLASLARHFPNNPPRSLRLPPPAKDDLHSGFNPNITAWEFPEWFVVQETQALENGGKRRRMVHKTQLEKGRYRNEKGKKQPVVPIRFVRACVKGHIDEIDWKTFVHENEEHNCTHPLWIEERGSSGALADTWILCGCSAERSMALAAREKLKTLGFCQGRRPWLGPASKEGCDKPARLLIRSASNAYFPQISSAISIPRGFGELDEIVKNLWDKGLNIVAQGTPLAAVRQIPTVGPGLQNYSDAQVNEAIERFSAKDTSDERPIKEVEFKALSGVVKESGKDTPNGDFFARALASNSWKSFPWMKPIENVVLVHRLREVSAQVGFTRLEAVSPQLDGEFDLEVETAPLSRNQDWLPAAENRGEGIFIQFDSKAIEEWLERDEVKARGQLLNDGFRAKFEDATKKPFYGAPFYLIHSFSHLLMNRIALDCGYPASSIRERIYSLPSGYGLLIYTASSDAQGTLGGLVQAGRDIANIVRRALAGAELCSNDPVCSNDKPDLETQRELLGAACHGCQLVAETSCEWGNFFLDRELVVKTMRKSGAAFFSGYEF